MQHDASHEHGEAVDRDHARDRLVRAVVVDDVPLHDRKHAGRRATPDERDRRSAASSTPRPLPEQRAASTMSDRGAERARAAARSRASRSTASRSLSVGAACASDHAGSPRRSPRPRSAGPSLLTVGLLVVAACPRRGATSALDASARPGRAPASGRGRGTARAPSSGTTVHELAERDRRCIVDVLAVGLAGERALERPQHVDRGEDHAGRRDDRVPAAA